MTDHITKAKAQADALDIIGYSHPTYEKVALRGILHGILALHEQNAAGRTPLPRKTPTKETSK